MLKDRGPYSAQRPAVAVKFRFFKTGFRRAAPFLKESPKVAPNPIISLLFVSDARTGISGENPHISFLL
jgi:hypothetical protein